VREGNNEEEVSTWDTSVDKRDTGTCRDKEVYEVH
jgi:hypothetical protein